MAEELVMTKETTPKKVAFVDRPTANEERIKKQLEQMRSQSPMINRSGKYAHVKSRVMEPIHHCRSIKDDEEKTKKQKLNVNKS